VARIQVCGKYSPEAWEGVNAEGAVSRETNMHAMFESLGAEVECYYMLPGSNYDFTIILNNADARPLGVIKKMVGPPGAVIETEADVLMTAEDWVAVECQSYRPPVHQHCHRGQPKHGCAYQHLGAPKSPHPKTVERGAPPTPERLDNSQIGA